MGRDGAGHGHRPLRGGDSRACRRAGWIVSRKLRRRGLRGVKLVISDAHEGLKGAVAKIMNATWQRCRVHTMRNALARRGQKLAQGGVRLHGHRLRSRRGAERRQGLVATNRRSIASHPPGHSPGVAAFMDAAEIDVLAYMSFPREHWAKLHSTNGLERLNGEVKRRTDVVGIFPNDDAMIRLVGAILLEQNDEWAVQRSREMTLETIAQLSDNPIVGLPTVAI